MDRVLLQNVVVPPTTEIGGTGVAGKKCGHGVYAPSNGPKEYSEFCTVCMSTKGA